MSVAMVEASFRASLVSAASSTGLLLGSRAAITLPRVTVSAYKEECATI